MYGHTALLLVLFVHFGICRDFYVGMFKKNDYLVAQDRLYKEKVPFRSVWARYGRHFKCPITYFRVVDRLGVGRGPSVEIVRGGLRKKYVVLRLQAVHNQPISVNIYVGCENKMTTAATTRVTKKPEGPDKGNATTGSAAEDTGDANGTEGSATEGSATEGGATEGSTTEGSATEGSATEGSVTEGEATQGEATEGEATEGEEQAAEE